MSGFKSTKRGVVVTLESGEVELLENLVGQVRAVLTGGVPEHGSDPVRDRLFPRAYVDPTEDRAERDFQSVVHEDLVLAKSAAIEALVAGLDGGRTKRGTTEVTLDREGMEQWLAALNDVRLAFGAALGITEDRDPFEELPDDDPRAGGLAVLDWLGYLQSELLDVMMETME
ncbi:MAG: DUF2017 family protein [Acidimicrobiia bacterium]|nr:DUF2017 family protein [Acidimicrobiia bacterium]